MMNAISEFLEFDPNKISKPIELSTTDLLNIITKLKSIKPQYGVDININVKDEGVINCKYDKRIEDWVLKF